MTKVLKKKDLDEVFEFNDIVPFYFRAAGKGNLRDEFGNDTAWFGIVLAESIESLHNAVDEFGDPQQFEFAFGTNRGAVCTKYSFNHNDDEALDDEYSELEISDEMTEVTSDICKELGREKGKQKLEWFTVDFYEYKKYLDYIWGK